MSIYRPICLPKLKNILGGRESYYESKLGRIYYTYQGRGEKLLIVHGINAGASNFEWRNNFKKLADYFTVYALDLPGFARSTKEPTTYTAKKYIKAITEFIKEEIKEPVHILSSGLSAAYLSTIAYQNPNLIRKLALVTPSGVNSNSSKPCPTSFTVYNIFTSPVQGDGLYNAFVSKPSITYFLKEFIYTKPSSVNRFVVNYTFHSAHQCPYAKYAPASFISGFSNIDISPYFGQIEKPILILWGEDAKLNPVKNLDKLIELNPAINTYIFKDTGLIPQIERAEKFNSVIINFLLSK